MPAIGKPACRRKCMAGFQFPGRTGWVRQKPKPELSVGDGEFGAVGRKTESEGGVGGARPELPWLTAVEGSDPDLTTALECHGFAVGMNRGEIDPLPHHLRGAARRRYRP